MADRMRDKAEPARERDDVYVPPRLGAPEPLPSAPPDKDLPLSALDGPGGLAADLAADEGQITWLTEPATGKRVAAIVPAGLVTDSAKGWHLARAAAQVMITAAKQMHSTAEQIRKAGEHDD